MRHVISIDQGTTGSTVLVLDEHEQVKILSHRTWRGVWRAVTLWRDGMHGLSAHDLMQYLVQLATLAQQNAPASARFLKKKISSRSRPTGFR